MVSLIFYMCACTGVTKENVMRCDSYYVHFLMVNVRSKFSCAWPLRLITQPLPSSHSPSLIPPPSSPLQSSSSLPTSSSYLLGNPMMKSWMYAAFAAWIISSSLAPGLPFMMFSRMLQKMIVTV